MKTLKLIVSFSKRVINMKKTKISTDIFLDPKPDAKQQNQLQKIYSAYKQLPGNWEVMPFDQLCALPSSMLKALQLEVNKDKFSIHEDKYRITPLLNQPKQDLNPYWKKIYQILRLQSSLSLQQIKSRQQKGDLSSMFLEHPFENEQLQKVIEKFIDNIRFPKNLQGIAEPSFNKYLLGLRRDLLMQGADIDIDYNIDQNGEQLKKFKEVKLIKIINYEHQFWCDVSQNRLKNGLKDDFIEEKRIIDNPNGTSLLTSKYPKISVLYITKKHKNKVQSLNFCHKIDIVVEIQDKKHIVRVEQITMSKNFNPVSKNNRYLVIDFDYLMKGNSTIKPIFQF